MRRAATRGPPSLKTRVIPRAESAFSAAPRSTWPSASRATRSTKTPHARSSASAPAGASGAGDDEGRQIARAGRKARAQRKAQMRVEDDPPGFPVEAGQAHRQRGIVDERRLDPDHDRLVRRAHRLHARVGDRPGDS